ncbi:3-oxosteroid 1-dehydrogenase-like protein [Hapsidospora chrysogenum ATCC 11550]|uniref:3-oxosteroid 1-dehydrogenase-like protein n=1 Tax=Hapsidospora chrysogenum (strain ATCC 11550 / CBS 779.69 / DSM 880 / IAM 14645 / JCM 23072 / IMI 49137) TaxID=857340 RepID=A0A086T3Q2_HAPC1|nr:3-oxosteroid 1-dehydrogenase-like protein [Hapsidospora chrysogenum ATCC 11550]
MAPSLWQRRGVRVTAAVSAVAVGTVLAIRTNRQRKHLPPDSIARAANSVRQRPDGSYETDVLVVGSGGAALAAALRARSLGLSVLVTEKNAKVGGTTAYSGSGCWIPNTHVHNDTRDSPEKALTYLESIIGDVGPASSRERKLAFLREGPEMVKYLEDEGYRWIPTPGYPDYHQFHPGAMIGGRSIEAGAFDRNLLGPWKDMININPARAPVAMYTFELSKMVRAKADWDGKVTAAKAFGLRVYPAWLLGSHTSTLGVSMISQLLYLNLRRGTSLWVSSPLKDLQTDKQGDVVGATVEHGGKPVTVHVSRGVVLAAGGFAHNAEMRQKYQPKGITSDWTSASRGDQGDAITAAIKIGAATALMDSAWWGTSIIDPATNQPYWCLYDRVMPHSIIVDQEGRRFANESLNYNTLGTKLWEHSKDHPAIPSYMVMDTTHRNKYVLAGKLLPGFTPQSALDSGFLTKADSIPELAEKLGVPARNLAETVERFNGFAKKGVDEDFERGKSPYDRFLGDPSYKNPNLGELSKPPYYAVKIWPGDLGTKGGVLTDEHARALREGKEKGKYEPIRGLYAIGNSSASVMGRTYAGAGSTLGPGLTFGYIAANDMAKRQDASK